MQNQINKLFIDLKIKYNTIKRNLKERFSFLAGKQKKEQVRTLRSGRF